MSARIWIIVIFVILTSAGLIIFKQSSIQNTDTIFWPVETNHLKDRLNAIGLPALTAEGTVLHTHQHLDIFINGQHVLIPAGIGINDQQGFISPIHTHDTSGIIHVESPTIQNFTLGQFFQIWGVSLTQSCIADYCNKGNSVLRVFSNGQEIKNNFTDLKLESHQEIVIFFGPSQNFPSSIPSKYNFPSGY